MMPGFQRNALLLGAVLCVACHHAFGAGATGRSEVSTKLFEARAVLESEKKPKEAAQAVVDLLDSGALTSRTDLFHAFDLLTRCYQETGDHEQAIQLLTRADGMLKEPQDTAVVTGIVVRGLYSMRKPEEAVRLAETRLSTYSEDPMALAMFIQPAQIAFAENGQTDRAVQIGLDLWRKYPTCLPLGKQAVSTITQRLFMKSEYKKAYEVFKEANSINPELFDTYVNMKAQYGIYAAHHPETSVKLEALEVLEQFMEDHPEWNQMFMVQDCLGRIYMSLGDPARAKLYFEMVMRNESKSVALEELKEASRQYLRMLAGQPPVEVSNATALADLAGTAVSTAAIATLEEVRDQETHGRKGNDKEAPAEEQAEQGTSTSAVAPLASGRVGSPSHSSSILYFGSILVLGALVTMVFIYRRHNSCVQQ